MYFSGESPIDRVKIARVSLCLSDTPQRVEFRELDLQES